MNLDQPLFPKNHLQQLLGELPRDLGVVELEGHAFQVNVVPGVEGDLARINELGDKPDLFAATYLVDGVVECLEGTKVADLTSAEEIAHLSDYLRTFTQNDTLQQIMSELAGNDRGELGQCLEHFVVACRELLPELGEFGSAREADPVSRFHKLQPILAKVIDAHRAFYLKFREA